MNKIVKVVMINAIVFFVLFIFISLSIFVYSYYIDVKDDLRAQLPNYKGVAWAETHFLEFSQLSTLYYDYIIWRRRPFSGETINIDQNGIRTTVNGERKDRTAFFFGGSTMWGTGADDANTIPSIFASNSPYKAYNFGETAWTAHQSLNQLMKLYIEGQRPDLVVFYDGYNEVSHKCRSELNFYSAAREHQMRQTLRYSTNPKKPKYYVRLFLNLADKIKNFSSKTPHRNCHLKPDKARLIATALVQDWQVAKSLVEGYCGQFVAILQPNAYVGSPRLDHLQKVESDEQLRLQISAVYPVVRQEMAARNIGHDFTDAFDGEEYLYIDPAHVSPAGNARIAARLSDLLASMESNGVSANSSCSGAGPDGRT